MKYIKQFGIIMVVTCIGEIIKNYVPLPIPSSIYGLCIMMLLLVSKVVKIDDVKDAGLFLIDIMPLMFIPSAVGLLVCWKLLKGMLLPFSITIVISTIIVMVISGSITQYIMRRKKNE